MTASHQNKRFWTDVTVAPEVDGFEVRLDDRPVRIPEFGPLRLPNRALADAVAVEWREAGGGASGGSYGADALGLTRLAGSMLFRVAPQRDAVAGRLLSFLDNELLCYRATHPAPLVRQQQQHWQPWLDWCRDRLGAALATTEGLMPIRQGEAAHGSIGRALARQDAAGLTALGVLAPALNSLVLALACVEGALSAADAHRLSLLDDRFQAEQWGADREAEQRQDALLVDCRQAERFLLLARPEPEPEPEPDTVLLVEGRVQGVGYRNWLQHEALRLGLRGWVRNLWDGRVEARLSGAQPLRSELVRLAGTGPRMAVVRSVVTREEPSSVETFENNGFEVRPTAAS